MAERHRRAHFPTTSLVRRNGADQSAGHGDKNPDGPDARRASTFERADRCNGIRGVTPSFRDAPVRRHVP